MYKVTVKSRGKYNNVIMGARYCLTKRSAVRLTAMFIKNECYVAVEKWTRMHGDVFCWSESEIGKNFWDKVKSKICKILDLTNPTDL